MLTALNLENFKSWHEIGDMRLAPMTGLFGANSSGKTSILQLLLMLKQTVASADRSQVLNLGDDRSQVSLGTFEELIYGHESNAALRWGIEWTLPSELKIANPESPQRNLFSGNRLVFSADIREDERRHLYVQQFSYEFGEQRFEMKRLKASEDAYEVEATSASFSFRRPPGRTLHLSSPVKCYGFPEQVRTYFLNAGFLADFELAFESLFSRLYYLGPLREDPRRVYTWSGERPMDVGRRGERAVEVLLASRERGEFLSWGKGRGKKKYTLEEYVAFWLQRLGLIYSFEVERISEAANLYRVWVRKDAVGSRVLLTDVGFGVSQVLPVLVLLYSVPEGSTILLEQPEIHLHPSVQAKLADVFIDAIKRQHIQIILESHSEHLLLRLRRRIAEEYRVQGEASGFLPEDASLYFCTIQNGTSELTPLDLDSFGNIRNWPPGFFGDDFGEMAAMTEAVIARKRRESA